MRLTTDGVAVSDGATPCLAAAASPPLPALASPADGKWFESQLASSDAAAKHGSHASSPSEDEDWFATYGSSGASTPSAGGAAPLEGLLTSLLATPTDDRLCSAVVDAFCLRSSFSCQVVASPGVLAC